MAQRRPRRSRPAAMVLGSRSWRGEGSCFCAAAVEGFIRGKRVTTAYGGWGGATVILALRSFAGI